MNAMELVLIIVAISVITLMAHTLAHALVASYYQAMRRIAQVRLIIDKSQSTSMQMLMNALQAIMAAIGLV